MAPLSPTATLAPSLAGGDDGDVEEDIPEPYRGIGIRIEDNIVITGEGYQMLTGDVPKTIAEIEALMAEG